MLKRWMCVALGAAVALGTMSFAQTARPVTAPLTAGERLQNLDKLKARLKQYHDCAPAAGCYSHDLDREANLAIAFLVRSAAHNPKHEKLAVVLDIDETTLSNYKEMLQNGFAYDAQRWDAWVASENAPAIPGTLRLYKEAKRLGFAVFFLTGRPESERADTDRNLKAEGFDGYAGLLLRGAGEEKMTAAEYKSRERAKLAAEGYRIALSVGDQWSDLRGKPEAEYSVKYPNPFYYIP